MDHVAWAGRLQRLVAKTKHEALSAERKEGMVELLITGALKFPATRWW
jgi:hypothetical protein